MKKKMEADEWWEKFMKKREEEGAPLSVCVKLKTPIDVLAVQCAQKLIEEHPENYGPPGPALAKLEGMRFIG